MHTIDWHKWLGIPVNIALFLLSLFFMYGISDARVWELRASLKSIGRQAVSYNSNALVTRYKMLFQKHKVLDSSKSYITESKIASVLAALQKDNATGTDRLFFTPALIFVNAINRMVGKNSVLGVRATFHEKILEAGYYYERKRNYNKAISLYTKSLPYYEDSVQVQMYIYLHRGFCNSLLGNFKKAHKDYARVMALDENGDMASTAESLAMYTDKVQQRQQQVEDLPDDMNKVIEYYSAVSYEKALQTLRKIARSHTKKSSEFYFFRARSLEETGRTKQAIKDYKKVLAINDNKGIVTRANRRLYLLAAFYIENKQLVAEAKENARKNKDTKFIKEVQVIEKTVAKPVLKAEDADKIFEAAEAISVPKENKTIEDKKATELEYEVISLNREQSIEEKPEENKVVVIKKTKSIIHHEEKLLEKKEQEVTLRESKLDLLKSDLSIPARKAILKRQKELDKIYTKNGSKLIGLIYEKDDRRVKLLTAFGTIDVPRSVILKITKVGSEKEIK